ncbi:hypothetical protein [Pseudomonas sp.]|uniref:hypothetical protein n=1 Tax=Pseudomonas sp. TaxID=306 RepID=UPI003569DDB6
MHTMTRTLALLALACSFASQAEQADMTFFVTSEGSGQGANFGGLAGADAHCLKLAGAVGAGQHTWRAYLSSSASDGAAAVNARDRIGRGPWQNAKGVVIAKDVAQLHGDNHLAKDTALDEHGAPIKGRGDMPNMHDILTGSQADGTAFAAGEDLTCGNWTSSGEGSAQVGHHDRMGLRDDAPSRSWNSSHPSRGCSDEGLRSTGGAGLLYCFAVD